MNKTQYGDAHPKGVWAPAAAPGPHAGLGVPRHFWRRDMCDHPEGRRWWYRRAFTLEGGQTRAHCVERCQECGANPRGNGIWVPHAEAIRLAGVLSVGMLTLDPWEHPLASPKQGDLLGPKGARK